MRHLPKLLSSISIHTHHSHPQPRGLTRLIHSQFSKFACGSCFKKLQTPQCKSCFKMVNYFKVFDIPEDYSVDEQRVKQMAKELQKQFHPDKYNEEGGSLQKKMSTYSTYINEAKATLLNDLQRAIYLMELRGVQMKDEIEVKDNNFMMEIFELNQEIEDADLSRAQSLKVRIETMLNEVQQDLQGFFKSKDMDKCREFVVKYKYLSSALINAKMKINSLQDTNRTK